MAPTEWPIYLVPSLNFGHLLRSLNHLEGEGPLSALCSGGSRGGVQTEAPQPLPQDLDDHSPPTLSEGVDPPSTIAPNDLLSRVGSQNTGYFLLIKEN